FQILTALASVAEGRQYVNEVTSQIRNARQSTSAFEPVAFRRVVDLALAAAKDKPSAIRQQVAKGQILRWTLKIPPVWTAAKAANLGWAVGYTAVGALLGGKMFSLGGPGYFLGGATGLLTLAKAAFELRQFVHRPIGFKFPGSPITLISPFVEPLYEARDRL